MQLGILGSGSWGTALAKILTDNGQHIWWWNRNQEAISYLQQRRHNPHYLPHAYFNPAQLNLTTSAPAVFDHCDAVVIAIPSAYAAATLGSLPANCLQGKKIISAIKGILPEQNVLLNEFLATSFGFPLEDYFAVMGPCHAEEVAAEKLSYLTFSGIDVAATTHIATHFKTPFLNTVVNHDVFGVQYAAVLKNIYALGAGIAHGLDYGDNFLSVLIANSADEMASFLRKLGLPSIEVGSIGHTAGWATPMPKQNATNYAASVYLGDLLVTCYSLFSRNRTFGNMIGKGYSVQAAQIEMSMVAEGYNASRCMYRINQQIGADMPIAETVYRILWEQLPAKEGFNRIESTLV